MTHSGEFDKVVPEHSFGDVVTEEADVVVVRAAETRVRGSRNPLSIFPLMLGVLILALDIYLLVALPNYIFFAKNLQGAISLALVFASGIICLFLIAYAFGLRSFESADGHQRRISPYVTGLVVPLILGAVALAATIGGMELNRSAGERQPLKSCIDLIEQAHNIAKDNPKFRMPAKDANEIRCSINSALGF